jgi:hypothetical protein
VRRGEASISPLALSRLRERVRVRAVNRSTGGDDGEAHRALTPTLSRKRERANWQAPLG